MNEPVRSHPHKIGTDSSWYFSPGHQRNCQPLISAGTFPMVPQDPGKLCQRPELESGHVDTPKPSLVACRCFRIPAPASGTTFRGPGSPRQIWALNWAPTSVKWTPGFRKCTSAHFPPLSALSATSSHFESDRQFPRWACRLKPRTPRTLGKRKPLTISDLP